MSPLLLDTPSFYSSPLLWSKQLKQGDVFRLAEKEAKQNEYAPFEMVQTTRLSRLKKLLQYASKSVPLYRDLYNTLTLSPDRMQSEAYLQSFPIVNKSHFRKYGPTGCIAIDAQTSRMQAGATSGSTGEPFQFFTDRAYEIEQGALATRVWRWVGVSTWAPKIYCSAPRNPSRWPNTFPVHPHYIFSRNEEYAEIIRASGARLIFGNPLTTFELLWALHENGYVDIKFDVAALTGQALPSALRSSLQRSFVHAVTQYYALMELGILAVECEAHNGLHIQEENTIIEVVDTDGDPVTPGNRGRIVVTSLSNEVMPFIRYDIGDFGFIRPNSCPCGRSSRLLTVEGRSEDLFLTPSGEIRYSTIFRDKLDEYFEYFHKYQAIQSDLSSFTIKVVPTNLFTRRLEKAIVAELLDILEYPAQVSFVCVDTLPSLSNGKFQQFISTIWQSRFLDRIAAD